jgi:hypothetical protein
LFLVDINYCNLSLLFRTKLISDVFPDDSPIALRLLPTDFPDTSVVKCTGTLCNVSHPWSSAVVRPSLLISKMSLPYRVPFRTVPTIYPVTYLSDRSRPPGILHAPAITSLRMNYPRSNLPPVYLPAYRYSGRLTLLIPIFRRVDFPRTNLPPTFFPAYTITYFRLLAYMANKTPFESQLQDSANRQICYIWF